MCYKFSQNVFHVSCILKTRKCKQLTDMLSISMRVIDDKSLLITGLGGQYLLVRKVLDQTT